MGDRVTVAGRAAVKDAGRRTMNGRTRRRILNGSEGGVSG